MGKHAPPPSGDAGARPWAGVAAISAAVAAFAAVLAGWRAGGGGFDLPWVPALDLRLAFELDGLGALYGLLAAGVGVAVFVFSSAYLPRHLRREGRPRRDEWRFHGLMVLFLLSMIGLATAQDLFLLFVFWELTAIASYLLIGFDRRHREARLSALMALLVTTVSAMLLLIGILVLRAEYGTTSLEEIVARARPGDELAVAGVLIAVAALAKSAQVPLHFWLPRAMAAPTPVSAYLHSAAMVAAGVFLLSRVHPLLERTDGLLDGLLVVGLLSMAVGGTLALSAHGLKRVLAYSTISQYGYVVAMLGVGGAAGAAAACFYVIAHGLAKSALFMTSGAVAEATGGKSLAEVGGLARRMPWLAAGSGLAAAGLAALPLTIGFFKDELFFKAAAERGTWLAVLAVLGAALTFAYVGRFWAGLFLGPLRRPPEAVPRRLVAPVVALGAVVAFGGIVVAPFAELAQDAAVTTAAGPVELSAAYHLDLRSENVMALATYVLGALLLAARPALGGALAAVARLGEAAGPERVYIATLGALNRLSNALHDLEVRDLRTRIIAVLVPGGVLVVLGLAATPWDGAYRVGEIVSADAPLIAALAVVALAAVLVTFPRGHLQVVLSLSAVGFSLAVAYELLGAPDVALVAVLVETILTLLFVGVLAVIPRDVLRREAALRLPRSRRWRDPLVGTLAGAAAFLTVWGGLSRPLPEDPSAARQIELAGAAHGSDVVTVILADFRGLDTLVEITVVFVAMVGMASLLRRGRL